MFTRFANLFYLPILGKYVDRAVQSGNVNMLYEQIQWVVLSSALGALLSWLLLPTFTAIYERGIASITVRGSMLKMLLALPSLRGAKALFGCLRSPLELKTWACPNCADSADEAAEEPFALPWDLLSWNIFATAVWTVGALAALQVSALYPDLAATAVLLSGLVNSFAAIAFSLFVDPKAAVITDQAVSGQRHYLLILHLATAL